MVEQTKKIVVEGKDWYFIDIKGEKVGPFREKEMAEYAMDVYWRTLQGGVIKK